jgi:hypothetical protein
MAKQRLGFALRIACSVELSLFAATAFGAEPRDPLFRARVLYNQRQFEEAIAVAEEARRTPESAAGADLIAARSYLELYRESASAEDLISARERLRRIDADRLGSLERVEFVVGLGEALYFDASPGAAAAVFESVLMRRDQLGPEARERVLDWWASAVDREARPRPEMDRRAMYQTILSRMREELGVDPSNAVAAYWLCAAARGQGDLQAAWDAAEAGWVRAPLAKERAAALRADLDRLVLDALVPERARLLAQPPDVLKAEWEEFKQRWER